MLAENRLSNTPVVNSFLAGRDLATNNLLDYSIGGININDPSQGLLVQTWRGRLIGNDIILDVPDNINIIPVTLYSGANITEINFAFDQLMKPYLVFVQGGESKLYWYDSVAGGYSTTNYGDTVINPRLTLDDKRATQTSSSDVIFAYIRLGSLYYRQQRDRFLVERLLANNFTRLNKIGMGNGYRLLFQGLV